MFGEIISTFVTFQDQVSWDNNRFTFNENINRGIKSIEHTVLFCLSSFLVRLDALPRMKKDIVYLNHITRVVYKILNQTSTAAYIFHISERNRHTDPHGVWPHKAVGSRTSPSVRTFRLLLITHYHLFRLQLIFSQIGFNMLVPTWGDRSGKSASRLLAIPGLLHEKLCRRNLVRTARLFWCECLNEVFHQKKNE